MNKNLSNSINTSKNQSLVKIGEAAKTLGVSIDTIRRWEKAGKIATVRTLGGTRLFRLDTLKKLSTKSSSISSKTPSFKPAQPQNPFKKPLAPQNSKPLPITQVLDNIEQSTSVLSTEVTSPLLHKQPQEVNLGAILSQSSTPLTHKVLLTLALFFFGSMSVIAGFAAAQPQEAQRIVLEARNFLPGNVTGNTEEVASIFSQNLSAVLAATTAASFLEINSDVNIAGSLFTSTDQVNGLTLRSEDTGFTIAGGATTSTVTVTAETVTLDQDLSTTSDPTFNTLSLGGTENQLIFQVDGPTGTLTWTPTADRVITLPDATTTLVGIDTTQTLTNKTISGSSNTFSSIPNSALTNSKITVTAGTNLTGGGDAELGNSISIALKDSPSITGTLTVAGATTLSSTLAVTGASTLSSTLAVTGASTFASTLDVTGETTLNSDVTLGDATSDNITATGRFASSLIPSADNTYDLGTSALKFNNLYVNGISSSGQQVLTFVPTGTGVNQGTLYLNPASATADYTMLGIAINGTQVTRFDSDGDITTTGDLAVNGGDITSTGTLAITPATTLTLNSTGDLTLDSSTDIIFDVAGSDVVFKENGTTFLTISDNTTDVTLTPAGGDLGITGTLDVSGHSAFGNNASVNSDYALSINEIFTNTSGTKYSLSTQLTANPASDSSGTYVAHDYAANTQSGTARTYSGYLAAGAFAASHWGTGYLANAIGGWSFVTNESTGTINSASGYIVDIYNKNASSVINTLNGYSFVVSDNTGSIGTVNGFYIDAAAGASNSVTNYYGGVITAVSKGSAINAGLVIAEAANGKNTNLLIGTTTVPTGSFSIYNSSADNNYFAGKLGIADTTPSNALTVTGAASVSSYLQVGQETATTYSRFGAGTTGHTLSGADALLVTGAFEVDGAGYFDSTLDVASTLTANTFASSGATITGGTINSTTIGAVTPSTGAFTTLTSSGNSTLGTGASGAHTFGSGAGSTVGIGNSTGALTIASGGTSAWTNTSGDLTISTATSGTFALDSAGALTVGGTTATSVGIGRTGVTTTNNGALTVTETLTANGAFDANGQFDLGDGGDAGTISATTLDIDATGALQINSSGGEISIGNDAVAQNINIGTGAAARTITIGNNTTTSALAFTSGTGSQTFTSSVVSTSGTSSAFVFNDASLTTGTLMYLQAAAVTTGKLLDINTGSSIFSVSNTDVTTSLPVNFTSSGDVSIAYDINFTNPTASYIKSLAPLYLQAGPSYSSNNIVLQTYNQGTVVVDTATTTGTSMNLLSNSLTTGTGLLVNANALTTGSAVNISSTSTAATTNYLLNLSSSGAANSATRYGVYTTLSGTGTTSVNVAGYFSATGATTNRGIEVAAMTGATSTGLTIGALSGSTANTGVSIGAITSAATANNFGINIGAITSQASATSYAINTGAISGAGTATYGINLGANSSTATTNYGMKIGAISGAGTTNYGLYVDTVSGAGSNYAAIFAGGNVGIADTSPTNALAVTGAASISSYLQVGQETATTYSRFGSGTTGHTLSGADALLVTGALEVDGAGYFDSTLDVASTLTANIFSSSGATITGGTINGTVIGGVTPAAGTFTDLTATGNVQLGDNVADTLTVYPTTMAFLKENAHTIQIADSTTADTAGSTLTLKGAAGVGTGAGGALALTAGAGGATGTGGGITLTTGAGGATSGTSGALNLLTGTAASGAQSGIVTLRSGNATAADSGATTISTGTTTTSGVTGALTLSTGNSAGNSGSITIDPGTSSSTVGSLLIGTSNATTVTIGGSQTTSLSLTDDSWSITAAGIASFGSYLQVGSATATTYSRFGTGTTGHTLSGAEDVLVSGDLELDGTLYLDGALSSASSGAFDSLTVGGGYGDTGVTISSAGVIQADGAVTFASSLDVTGITTLTGNLNANGGLDVDDAFVVADGGALTTSQLATFNGSIDLGSDSSDTLTLNAVVDSNLTFIKEVARTIQIADSTTADTAGSTLTIKGAAGTGTGAGGAINITGGAAPFSGVLAGGTVTIQGGAGGAGSTAGASLTLNGGAGGTGGHFALAGANLGSTGNVPTSTITTGIAGTNGAGGSLSITLGAGNNTSSGGAFTVTSGNGGAAGTAGNISFDVGTSGSSNGSILIGTAARAQTITIGNSTGGTITLGQSSGSNLVLNDAQWSVTGAGAATFATVNKLTLTAPATSATLTLADGSSLITSGGHSLTFTTTDTTSLTLPTTGTLSTLAGIESLSNKTLVSPVITTSPTAAGSTWTDLGIVTTADINGGTIDGVTIGGSTAAAGTFTTLTSSGNSTLGTGASGAHTFGSGAGSTVGIGNSTGALTIASGGSSSWANTSGNIALSTVTSGDITATTAVGTGLFNVLTGNLRVGTGATPGLTLDGEDAFIEGTLEVDGAAQFDGAATVAGTLTANGAFDANGQFDLGDGGDAGTISATTLDIDATGALQINSSGGEISIGNDAVAQNINIGTGAAARTITIGNNTTTSALAFTSGTGSQTFTSSVVSTTGTSSAFVFNDAALTTGTLMYLQAAAVTTGNLLDINTGSSIFSISNTALTTSLPVNFTSSGDVSIAYDINFTNPVTSYIKSIAPITIVSGEAFNSSNLTLQTYNQGTVVVDTATTTGTSMNLLSNSLTTGTGLLVNANALTTGTAASISSTSTAGGASGSSYLLNLSRSGANSNTAHSAYGVYSTVTNTNATSGTNIAGYFSASGATTANYGLIVAAGNVGIGDTSPSSLLEVGDGTDSIQFSSVGDITFVDANGAATITGPAGGALNINSANSQNLALGTTTAGNITLTPAAATGLVNILTGNLKVGNGTPGVTLDGDDTYLTGTLEVDGATQFDGAVTFNSTQTYNSDVDLVFAGNENATITNTTNTLGASGMLDLASTSSTTDTRTLDISTTFSSTGATTSYGLYNTWASSAVVTGAGVSQTAYGSYNTATKTGADDATGTYTLYGAYSTASNTGSTDAGTKNTYGGYFTATGDTAGTSTAYGIYASAASADTNYGIYVAAGTVNIQGLAASSFVATDANKNLSTTADSAASASLASILSDETGSGKVVFDTSPTLVTPVLGVATATSINKLTLTAPATSATLTLADGSSLITSGGHSLTFTTTDTTSLTLPTTGTLSTLAGIESLSNKTLVSPVITTSPTAAGSTWTDLGIVTTADINGGTIDGVTIGGSTAAAGTFTTLTATGNVQLGDNVADTLTVYPTTMAFLKENAHTIQIADSTTSNTAGGALTIKSGAGAATNAAGGALSLAGGAGAGTGAGGALNISGGTGGGDGSNPGAGGAINLTAGSTTVNVNGSGNGGAIALSAGIGSANGSGGAVSISAGTLNAGNGVNGAGGAISITAGSVTGAINSGFGPGGAITITSGGGSATTTAGISGGGSGAVTLRSAAGGTATTGTGGAAGAVAITGGNGGTVSSSGTGGAGGSVAITGGNSGSATGGTAGNAGAITLTGGTGALAKAGGAISLSAGQGGATAAGGAINLTTGAGGSSSGTSGALNLLTGTAASGAQSGIVTLRSGNATTADSGATTISTGTTTTSGVTGALTLSTGNSAGNSGAITIDPGTSASTVGSLLIGNTNARTITIGSSSATDVSITDDSWSITAGGAAAFASVNGNTITTGTGTLTLGAGKTLTASDTTTLATNSITFGGTEILTLAAAKNVTFADAFATSGAFSTTLTATGTTDVTLPTTGTLATLAGIESLSNKTLVSPVITTSPTAAGATWTDLGIVTTADINGGTIDGTIIGGSTAAAGTFTTLTATGNVQLGDNVADTLTIYPTTMAFLKENAHTIQIADSTTADTAGGALTIKSGTGNGSSVGGAISITAGNAGSTLSSNVGGAITLTAGSANNGTGGNLNLNAGAGTGSSGGTGGAVNITGGNNNGGVSNGGAIVILSGTGGATGTGGASGAISLSTANGTATGTSTKNSGNIALTTGSVTVSNSTAGNISLDVGASTTSNGSILIGTAARAQTITIGNSTGGTITLGQSSGSDLALNDAQWSITGAGAGALDSLTVGGGYGSTGVTISNAGVIQADGAVTFASDLDVQGNTTLGNLNTADTLTGNLLTSAITSGATTQTAFSVAGTGFTTGELLDLTGTFAPADGTTNEAIDINITHTPTVSADNFQSLNLTTTDGTALGNTVYNQQNTLTLTGNAAKTGIGVYSTVTSSSTTADTLYAGQFATSATGALSTGTRSVYGINSAPASTAASTGGTLNLYGSYLAPTSTLSNPGVTDTTANNVYGQYITTTATLTADCTTNCTTNQYGLYVANGTSSTNGTSTKYGLYVEALTGADNNIDLAFASTTPKIQMADNGMLSFTDGTNTLMALKDTAGSNNKQGLYVKNTLFVGDTEGDAGVGLDQRRYTMLLDRTWTASLVNAAALRINDTITAGTNLGIYFVRVEPGAMSTAATGTHPLFTDMYLATPTITNNGATVTDATTLYIQGAPVGTTSNPTTSIWVDAGNIRFDAAAAVNTGASPAYTLDIGSSTTSSRAVNVSQSGAKTAADYGAYIANTSTSSTDSINKYGQYITSTGTWNGASAINYGLYVDTPTGGTTNYGAIFAGGNVGIADTSPTNALTVTGAASVSSYLQVGQETATTYSRFGSGTTGHTLSGADALLVTGALEVDGAGYFDSTLDVASTLTANIFSSSGATITGGTINGTVIGGVTPAAGTFTTLVGTTINGNTVTTGTGTLTLGASKTLTVSDSTTLATDSITFAGTEILTLAAAKNVTFADAFATSGAFSTTLTATGTTDVTLPTTGTLATLAGIESLSNKTLVSPVITTSPTAAGATWTDLGIVTTADINGGTIDGVTIGGSTAAAGTFTDLTANGNVQLGDNVADTLTIYPTTMAFLKENAHTIQIADSTTGNTAGAALTIKGAAGAATNAAGGALNLTGGAGAGTGLGGAIAITAGAGGGGSGATGGAVTITSGGAGAQGSSGGITLQIGTPASAWPAGALQLLGANGQGTNGIGTTITMTAGNSNDAQTGGAINITAGGSAAGTAGAITLTGGGGSGGLGTNTGGAITLTTGAGGTNSGSSGALTLKTGTASSGDATGTSTLSTGNATAANSGSLTLSTGTTTTSGTTGDISITTGNSAGTSGALTLDVGTGTAGTLSIGATNGRTITIGSSSATGVSITDDSWSINTTGAAAFDSLTVGGGYGSSGVTVSNAGALSADGLITGAAGLTVTGGTVNLNASSNNATNINTGTSTGAVSIGNSLAGAIAISTGSTFGVTTTTSSQTYTSAVVSGATTSSAFVFTDNALTTGTGMYLNSSSMTTGTLLGLSATAITSGKFIDISNGSSIFSVSNTDVTTSLPVNFTSSGDVSIAYDINFTNPTASYIKSSAPMYIQAGPSYANNDLVFQTFGTGTVLVDQSIATTGSPTAFKVNGAAHTALTASTEASDINFNLNRTVQFGTGTLATQRAIQASAPTYGFVGASGLTNATTLAISGAPIASTNATITSAAALRIGNSTAGAGAITTNYGIMIDAQTQGTADVGLYIADADTYSLQLASTDGDAASGITFGTDTNLYRSAADTLRTDDGFSVNAQHILALSGEVVFNETQADINFRVEGDNNANLLFLDAGLFTGVGQVSIGSASQGTATAFMVVDNPAISATADQNFYKLLIDNSAAVTIPTGTAALVASLAIDEPNITLTGAVTTATSLYIQAAPTEATNNYALFVDAGTSRFDGAVAYGAQQTFTDSDATPDVSAGTHFVTNTTTFTITDFDAGAGTLQAGHIIFVKSAGAITYDFDAGNLNLGAADIVTAAGDMTSWIYDGTDWNLISWMDDSATQMGGADLAEWFVSSDSMEPGDVVSINPNEDVVVQKSEGSYEQKVMGIVATQPGIILGTQDANAYAVALAGRVPTKVSTENGPIQRGDYLTSSSIPGVAMKATRPGQVIGKALEAFSCQSSAIRQDNLMTESETVLTTDDCQGKIMAFVNVSYADPSNFFASLSIDNEGNLIVPNLKVDKLAVAEISTVNLATADTSIISTTQTTSTNVQPYYDLSGKIASMEDRIKDQDARIKKLEDLIATSNSNTTQIATDSAGLSNYNVATNSANLVAEIASSSAVIASDSAAILAMDEIASSSATPRNDISELSLTPPDTLFATGSATLADLTVTSEAKFSDKLSAYNLTISNNLKALGTTTLGSTTIAGDLTVDGTLSISHNSLNSLTTLYLQNSPLAQGVDFFNGLVTIDKNGTLTAQTISANEYQAVAGTSVGTGTIKAGTKTVTISSSIVKPNSHVFVTPTVQTNLVLSITAISNGSFTVSLPVNTPSDITFNWWVVGEAQ